MNKNSAEYRKIDRQFLWHPYSGQAAMREHDFPVIVRGKGPFLYDAGGKRYFDAISSWWCCNLGHGHRRIVAAIKKQAGKLQHSILGNMSHPEAIELAANIAALFADRERRVFFASDGASAVEAALKIAAQYWHNCGKPERRRFVSLSNGYHGDTLGAVSVGFLPHFHQAYKPLTFPVYRAAAPDCAGCACGRKARTAPGGSQDQELDRLVRGASQAPAGKNGRAPTRSRQDHADACDCACFKSMEKIIAKHSGEIAAVIVEPLCQCAAGMNMYPPEYLKKLAALCRRRQILLIADEIAVGFGRTGKMFACEHAGIDPDIVCIGKALSGGCLPLSATVAKEFVYATFSDRPKDNTFYHGHTFAGNPIACAAAKEVLDIYRQDGIVEEARRKGALMEELTAPFRKIEGADHVRSLGMIAAVDITGNGGAARAQALKKRLWRKGVLVRPLGNVIYLMPPLVTPDGLIEEALALLAESLEAVS